MYDAETKQAVSRDGSAASFAFHGVLLWENFISEEEEEQLISSIDQNLWNESQSGRRKQVRQNNASHLLIKFVSKCFQSIVAVAVAGLWSEG